jgi:hypothetical protein
VTGEVNAPGVPDLMGAGTRVNSVVNRRSDFVHWLCVDAVPAVSHFPHVVTIECEAVAAAEHRTVYQS